MNSGQIFEYGAYLVGHSIWVGALAAGTYWLLGQAHSKLQPASKVWIGLLLLLLIPFVSTLATVAGVYRFPLAHRISIAIPVEVLAVIAILWGGGIVICILRLLAGIVQINSIVKTGRIEPDSRSFHLIREFRERFSIPTRPRIEMNDRVSVPFLTGLVSPRIVLPTALRKSDRECIDSIMVHELAHFFRKDTWFLMLQKFAEALFFYHPALRWLSGEIRLERERACDDRAVAMLDGNRMSYASALLAAESATDSNIPMVLAFGGESTTERANRIAFGSQSEPWRPGNVYLSTLLFLTMVVGGWSILSLVEVRSSLAKPGPIVDGGQNDSDIPVDPIPGTTWSSVSRIEAHWKDRVVQGREVQVFKSVPLIEKGGVVIDLTKENPRLFPEVPNQWLLQFKIDYLDGGMLLQDPDGDLFTTLEEYHAGTSPDLASSHPERVDLLSFNGLEYEVYRIQYRANPDSKTVQFTRTPSARHPGRQNFFVKVGETTGDGRVRLENISQDSITIRDLKSGQPFELKKKQMAELRTNHAALKMRKGELFYVEEGDSFYVPGDHLKKWTLTRVSEETCQLRSAAGDKRSFSRQNPPENR